MRRRAIRRCSCTKIDVHAAADFAKAISELGELLKIALAQRSGLGQQFAGCSRPLNIVTSSNGNSISAGSMIWKTISSCFL